MAELTIRPFSNADLPGLFSVWIDHWQAARYQVQVTITALERAILSRIFFDPNQLLVACLDGQIAAWSHRFIETDPETNARTATVASFSFGKEDGLLACDPLLAATEDACRNESAQSIRFGIARDDRYGYAGLHPIGYGIGVPTADTRTASLLSRFGYCVESQWQRFQTTTSTYRVRANRQFLQLRRQSRVDVRAALPKAGFRGIALSHLDVETHQLVNHLRRQVTADIDLWLSDLEVQIMNGGQGILALSGEPLTPEQQFLISVVIPTLATRNIY
ncbi:MAG: hypothetical protein AAF745_09930, partial [Planctomycetota bacterium]